MTIALVSVDGFEGVVPIMDKHLSKYESFMGIDTCKIYEEAILREQDDSSIIIRYHKLSNLPSICGYFTADSVSSMELCGILFSTMVRESKKLERLGYSDGDVVNVSDLGKEENNGERHT